MKRIALVIETSLASGRQIVVGVSRFLDEQNLWTVFQPTGPLGAMDVSALENWDGDGIIARIGDTNLLRIIEQKGLPTVDVLGNVESPNYPLVKCDDVAIGQTVAEHFLKNGHRTFGFIGLENERWSMERECGFHETARARGGATASFHIDQLSASAHYGEHLTRIKAWLAERPAPCAVMVASDQLAPLLFEAARQLGRTIPESLSVVGVDNDAPFCQLCRPRLSSVAPNHAMVGYEAAALLEQLMQGHPGPTSATEVKNHILHARLSSDLVAIEDKALLKALDYIRNHACENLQIDAVAAAAGLSRSVLQRRVRRQFDRSVGDLVLNEKLRTAQEMLTHTELPLAIVAERSGFNSQEYMNQIFKKHLKTTPRRYRLGHPNA